MFPPALRFHPVEDLPQDGDGISRRRDVESKSGLEPDARCVRHDDEPALNTFVVDPLRHGGGERRAGLLVGDELDREKHPTAADLADERIVADEWAKEPEELRSDES